MRWTTSSLKMLTIPIQYSLALPLLGLSMHSSFVFLQFDNLNIKCFQM